MGLMTRGKGISLLNTNECIVEQLYSATKDKIRTPIHEYSIGIVILVALITKIDEIQIFLPMIMIL